MYGARLLLLASGGALRPLAEGRGVRSGEREEQGTFGVPGEGAMVRLIRNQAGFTLIEIMVVIIILGLLAAIVMPRIVGETDRARYEQAKVQMRILEDALKRYKLDSGRFPTTDQSLDALVRKPTTGAIPRSYPDGGYLDKPDVPSDPWGNQYVYISPGQHGPDFDLKSFGADGLEGGEGYDADLENWRLQ